MFVYCQCHPPGLLLNVDTGQSIKKRWPWSSRYRTGHETNKLISENSMLRHLLKNSLGKQLMKRLFRTVRCILLLRICSVYSGLKIGIREMQHFYSSNSDNKINRRGKYGYKDFHYVLQAKYVQYVQRMSWLIRNISIRWLGFSQWMQGFVF